MAKGPVDIGEENMALNREDIASSREATEPNHQPRDRKTAETEVTRLKGQGTRRKNYEKGTEKQHLTALAAEEQRLEQRKRDEEFAKEALRQTKKAAAIGDMSIGCVIVYGDRTIARGYNRHSAGRSVLSHAEIISIKEACKKMGD